MMKVLLHICCSVCASLAIKRLKDEGFFVVGFFFNPNIHPFSEYRRRKDNLAVVKRVFSIDIIEGSYKPRDWFDVCKEYAEAPEGDIRCNLCYEFRLKETLDLCKRGQFDFFTTTLSISPHKSSATIFDVAKKIGGNYFLERNFKEKDGFKQAIDFSKEHKLYRQNYCGCVYSLLERRRG
jgi:predicted adenine nucleotide alpha hydrolase (AANH) superfamily ATPase